MTSTRPPTASTSPASVTRPGAMPLTDAAARSVGDALQDDDLTRGRHDAEAAGAAGEAPLRFGVELDAAVALDDDDVAIAILGHVHSLSGEGRRMLEFRHHVPRCAAATPDDLLVRAGPLGGGARARGRQRERRRFLAGARGAQRRARDGGRARRAGGRASSTWRSRSTSSPAELRATAEAMRRVVKPEGTVVLAVPSRDRPGARAGASYYELVDLFEPLFPSVKMVGQAPFAGLDAGRVRRGRSGSGARRHAGAQGRAGRVVRRRRRAEADGVARLRRHAGAAG